MFLLCSHFVMFLLFLLSLFYFFFFSSRRRHTRSLRDWSSDVCSSDLASLRSLALPPGPPALATKMGQTDWTVSSSASSARSTRTVSPSRISPLSRRSEERRVGKECRSRG